MIHNTSNKTSFYSCHLLGAFLSRDGRGGLLLLLLLTMARGGLDMKCCILEREEEASLPPLPGTGGSSELPVHHWEEKIL